MNIEKTHTISIFVVNKPGVLMRVAQVFSRRGFNIDSLVVSSSFDDRFARMTITAKTCSGDLIQIKRQLNKLVDVMHCIEHEGTDAIIKELALIKVACSPEERTSLLQIAEHFACKTVGMTKNSMIIEVTGNSDKVDAMLILLEDYKIIELVRTGKVLMARGGEDT
ncbi:MAG: acetolactate synthase small subunit [Lentisphaeraceae bacterium]|nr:acetolactate synthase small subunit [Lentisphaeraceae bacterium]